MLGYLRRRAPDGRPASSRRHAELSSGAMTNRLDQLEKRGLVSACPTRTTAAGVHVELTEAGREA